jgi:redox-sensitive bicupin YhaK (pirin superfamily)
MSAGHGIEHSEFNASDDAPVHFLQVWIQPDRVNAAPAYRQRAFDPADRRGRWVALASPDGAGGSLAIRQQAWLRGALLPDGASVDMPLEPSRRYWLHVARGGTRVAIDGEAFDLDAGDAIGVSGEAGTLSATGLGGDTPADLLLFDLPG